MSESVPARQGTESRMLWVQLLAGPILWSIHFLLSYLVVETFCRAGWTFNILGISGLSFIVIVLTLLAVLATALFALRSYRGWRAIHADRRLRDEFRESASWFEDSTDFMFFTGFLLSVLFAVTILMVGLPALFLQPC